MKKEILILVSLITSILILVVLSAISVRNRNIKLYNEGVVLLEEGKTDEAIECFSKIPNYTEYEDVYDLIKDYVDYDICPYCGKIITKE